MNRQAHVLLKGPLYASHSESISGSGAAVQTACQKYNSETSIN